MSEERVGILVEINGAENALSRLQEIQRLINNINRTSVRIFGGNESDGINRVNNELTTTARNLQIVQRQSNTTGRSLYTTFTRSLSFVRQMGSSFQVLGKTLTQISSPLRTLMRGTVFAAGFKLLNSFTSGIQDAADRWDTIATFKPIIKALGAGLSTDDVEASKQLEESYDKMYQSILGLPTGMGDMVDRFKLLTIATQDYAKATELTIAENNALIASASDESVATMAKKQFQTLMTTGKLTERQWLSLQKGIPVAWDMIEKKFKETGKITGELITNLKNGTVSAEEFADALIEVGNSDEMKQVLNTVMHTFKSAVSNVGNYAKSMGNTLITTINDILKNAFGKDLIDYINGVSEVIQDLTVEVQNWLKSNSSLITDFVRILQGMDLKGFLRGFGNGIKRTIQDVEKFFSLFSGKNAQAFGYFMGRAGYWGKVLSLLGAILKGFRMPLAALLTLVVRLGRGEGILGAIVSAITGRGNMGRAVIRRANQIPTVTQTLRGVFNSLRSLMTLAGGILIASGTGFIAFKSFKSMLSDLREIINTIDSIDWQKGKMAILYMAEFFTGFGALAAIVGKTGIGADLLIDEVILGAITTLAAGILQLNMAQIKNAMSNFKTILVTINGCIDEIGKMKSVSISGSNIKSAISALSEVYSMLKPKYQGDGIENMSAGESERMATVVGDMKSVLVSLKGAVETIASLNSIPDISAAKKNIPDLVSVLKDVYSEMSYGLYTKSTSKKSSDMVSITDNIISMVTSINGAIGTINELGRKTIHINGVERVLESFGKIRETLFKQFAMTEIKSVGGINVTQNKSYKSQANDMEYLRSMIGSIADIISYMNNAMSSLTSENAITSVSDFMDAWAPTQLALGALASWYESFWENHDGERAFKGMDKIAKNVGDIVDVVTYLQQALAKLSELKETINESGNVNVIGTLTSITPFISELNGIASALEGLKATEAKDKVDLMNNALESVKKLVDTAKSLESDTESLGGATNALANIVEAMKGMAEQIEEIASTWHDSMLNGLDFDGLDEAVISGLEGILKTMSGYESTFYRKGFTLGQKFKQGIQNQVRTINASSTVNINARLGSISGIGTLISTATNAIQRALGSMDITTTVNTTPKYSSLVGRHFGGAIYRANGGSVFKPRGTDTIPAMLTKGEFVQNRRAVNTFGLDFMRKVNSLDIEGAMRSLQARVNGRLSSARGMTVSNVVNNNNNQKVTMNVNTNNPDFAFKRTNRYVGAL